MSASEKLKALGQTSGPWAAITTSAERGGTLTGVYTVDGSIVAAAKESDATLIAALRNALPQIVALVSLVEKERNLVSGEIGDALDELERAVT
jgi:hypothetical protein